MQIQKSVDARIFSPHISRNAHLLNSQRDGLMNELHALVIPAGQFCVPCPPPREGQSSGSAAEKTLRANGASF